MRQNPKEISFEKETIFVSIDDILPTKIVPKEILETSKFKGILSSIKEVGLIEPLAVYPEVLDNGKEKYILLDGHLRLECFKLLKARCVRCLISTADEMYTYNRQINRISSIQEHKMILEAINKGVSVERIAASLNVNVEQIIAKRNLLNGIDPKVSHLLKDKMISKKVFDCLRKMKPDRQIEVAQMMFAANIFTGSYAEMSLATSRPDQLNVNKKKIAKVASIEELAVMEQELEKLHESQASIEKTLGEDTLALVVIKNYIAKLMRNEAVAHYLGRHHKDLFEQVTSIVESITTDTPEEVDVLNQ